MGSSRFSVPRSGVVKLEIFTAAGRFVRTLAHQRYAAGEHRVTWDGRDHRGQGCGSGVYFYRLESGDFTASRRMVLTR